MNLKGPFMLKGLFLFAILAGCKQPQTKVEERVKPELNPEWHNVGFLVMDGVFNTELTAPYDIFHHTRFRDGIKPMNVFTVGEADQVTTFEGLRLSVDYNYLKDQVPEIDILVVPSADGHMTYDLEDTAMLSFVREVAKQADWLLSHCDGAFVYGETGLLDGKKATTFPSDIDAFEERYPEIDVKREVLFVRDGNIITSQGGDKSFEASLYLTELIYGKDVADAIAAGLVIDWQLDSIAYLSFP